MVPPERSEESSRARPGRLTGNMYLPVEVLVLGRDSVPPVPLDQRDAGFRIGCLPREHLVKDRQIACDYRYAGGQCFHGG
jgi:hypothetical protein